MCVWIVNLTIPLLLFVQITTKKGRNLEKQAGYIPMFMWGFFFACSYLSGFFCTHVRFAANNGMPTLDKETGLFGASPKQVCSCVQGTQHACVHDSHSVES